MIANSGKALLGKTGGLTAGLGFYLADTWQDYHAHSAGVVSVLLGGALMETVGTTDLTVDAPAISIKPPDVRHADRIGPNGALLFSISVDDPALWDEAVGGASWSWRRLTVEERRLFADQLRDAASEQDYVDAALTVLSAAPGLPRLKGGIPRWIQELKGDLSDSDARPIMAIARDRGIHPVYLARAFRQWVGMSPSTFRRQYKVARGLQECVLSSRRLSSGAIDAGFSDQSHLSRSIRQATGFSLSELRRALVRAG